MKRILKIIGWSVLSIIVLLVAFMAVFAYKVAWGFPVTYETEVPAISFPEHKPAILLFSKSTGFRHSESIEAGKKVMEALAKKHGWFLYSTEEGGVFNPEQLARFDAVIFNNSTGRLLSEAQQQALENYVLEGGNWIGIHGAGDNSHHWDWYDQHLVGAHFSHHALKKHLQDAEVSLSSLPDSLLSQALPSSWNQTDEWYVFFDNPVDQGAHLIYSIDGEKIDPDGNILWIKNKNFGMGKIHPVAWYQTTGKGHAFYTSMGHDSKAWSQPGFVQLLENEIDFSTKSSRVH